MTSRRHIFLIGFSGSGKSTLGPLLASRLGRRFVDLDSDIEKHTHEKIGDIFRNHGERAFRQREIAQFNRVVKPKRPLVIALGGGAFESPPIRVMARRCGVTVFLSCSQRELYRRLREVEDRPLLDPKLRPGETLALARRRCISRLLKKRLANYRTADLILSTTTRTVPQSVRRLVRLLKTTT